MQVELADALQAEGAAYRPFLAATTGLDGSIATKYQTGTQVASNENPPG